jgi:RIO-like serine/threonine protein kinase
MVVMEYIAGTMLHRAKEPPLRAKDQIKTALKHLHDGGFVFGDLRPPNIMVPDQGGDVKLVDFDWAGKHGESRYPALLSSALQWPDGVKGLSIMETRHDIDMLEQLH